MTASSVHVNVTIVTDDISTAESAETTIQTTDTTTLGTATGTTVESFTQPTLSVLAYEAPSPPPPSPPPPSPPPLPPTPPPPSPPPLNCNLDFLSPKSYYEQTEYALGADGTLVAEFFQVEKLIHAQHQSVTTTSSGTNQAFVCGILAEPAFECLDIASSTTLSGVWNEVYTNSSSGAITANPFIDATFMTNVISAGDLNANLTNRFGMATSCQNKVVGDGVVSGMDLYVFGAAQFRLGPYNDIGDDLSAVVTTQGRPETRFRCGESYSRLDWQNRIAWETCFSPEDEDRYILSTGTGRRLLDGGEKRVSGLVLAKDSPSPRHTGLQLSSESGATSRGMDDLGAKMYLWSNASPLGRWYILNLPKIVIAAELFVRGAEGAMATQLNNKEAPHFNSSEVPSESNLFDLRFVRHRERSGLDSEDCAIVEASGSQLSALQAGTISVSQRMIHNNARSQLCAFDLVLWVPATAAVHRPLSCEVQLASGSSAMDGIRGSVQKTDSCASNALYDSNHFVPPPPPPPSLPGATPTASPPPSSPIDGDSSTGAVIGGAVGGVAGVTLVGAFAWWAFFAGAAKKVPGLAATTHNVAYSSVLQLGEKPLV